jgi:glycosyltransferase involved in cell wall biosynthesis
MIPKISVIVPVYKVEQYLHRCIDSILSQSFTDFELILVDDGSPDNCGKICDEYAEKDNRVRVFHKPNGGVSSARNLGLDNACGEFIVFIDSDDSVDKDYFAELVSFSCAYNTDFVVIDVLKTPIVDETVFLQKQDFNLLFSRYKLDKFSPPWGKLFKRKLIEQTRLRFNSKVHIGEDVMFVLLYILNIKDLVLLKSDKYIYERTRPGSLTKCSFTPEIELAGKIEIERVFDLLVETLNLGGADIECFSYNLQLYTERTLNSIMKLSNRKNRIIYLSSLDLTLYLKYKKPYSWKESIILFLLKRRWFYLYDFLLTK